MEVIDAVNGDGLLLGLPRAGSNMLARMEMIAMTTSNSIRVNARALGVSINLAFDYNLA